MSAAVRVESATRGDLSALVELLGRLFAQERELSPDPVRQRAGLSRILDDAAIGIIFVALDGSAGTRAVVGTCSLLFSVSTYLGAPAAWLEDVVVHPDWRARGVGTALLDAVKAFAHGRGIRRISLLTDFDNATAMRLYERVGFVRSTMVPMRLILEG